MTARTVGLMENSMKRLTVSSILVAAVAFTAPAHAQQVDEARAAVRALQGLRAVVEGGVAYREYATRDVDGPGLPMRALQSPMDTARRWQRAESLPQPQVPQPVLEHPASDREAKGLTKAETSLGTTG